LILKFVGQRSRSQLLKIEQKLETFVFSHDILRTKCRISMNLGTHMSAGDRRKPVDIEICRSKVKVTTSKNRTKIRNFLCFRTIS
jgi:hypothetical protein